MKHGRMADRQTAPEMRPVVLLQWALLGSNHSRSARQPARGRFRRVSADVAAETRKPFWHKALTAGFSPFQCSSRHVQLPSMDEAGPRPSVARPRETSRYGQTGPQIPPGPQHVLIWQTWPFGQSALLVQVTEQPVEGTHAVPPSASPKQMPDPPQPAQLVIVPHVLAGPHPSEPTTFTHASTVAS
jgi:hypothetical protein